MRKIINGKVKIIRSEKDYYSIRGNVVLVARNTHPDIVIAMKNIQAIVTEIDNRLCHAAIIAREYGKPLLMGIENATGCFKDGDMIQIDLISKSVRKIK